MGDSIMGKMDAMGKRMDELEQSERAMVLPVFVLLPYRVFFSQSNVCNSFPRF
jgi:hypothetical protein